jgi:hypothetical protein|tara:strand:+ start:4286 stop:4963 length:678 start_codon:yes stop_codon:yes gene_type:complete
MYNFGTHDIDLDINLHNELANQMFNTSDIKLTGTKNFNYFCAVPKDIKHNLRDFANNLTGKFNDWHFDYFHSGEPAGLHTDFDTVPWDEKMECHVVVGLIIPLEWKCKQPYTVNYNKVSEIPRKLLYRNGEMRYRDNNELFVYRDKWEYDKEVQRYNPADTAYAKEYADLKVHSVYEWKIGTAMLFDAKRWHSSSWFLSNNNLPETSVEYKRAIIGFGSIDVQRN